MTALKLFLTFFKVGALTFGGGYAMIPLISEEVVRNGWMTIEQLVNFIAVSESTPGPFAVNISTYVGMTTGGVTGAVFATLGVIMPSFIIILIVARCYEKFCESIAVKGIMSGLRPAVVGLIASAAVSIGRTVFFPSGVLVEEFTEPAIYMSAAILVLMLFFVKKKVHPIKIILISAVLGIIAGYSGLLNI